MYSYGLQIYLKWTKTKLFIFRLRKIFSSPDLALDLLLYGHSLLRPDTQISKPIFFCQRESNPTASNNDFVRHAKTSYWRFKRWSIINIFKHLQNHHRLNLRSHSLLSTASIFGPCLLRNISLKNGNKHELKYYATAKVQQCLFYEIHRYHLHLLSIFYTDFNEKVSKLFKNN